VTPVERLCHARAAITQKDQSPMLLLLLLLHYY